jgi:hypothetical protein
MTQPGAMEPRSIEIQAPTNKENAMPDERPDEKKPDVQEPPKDDDGDLPPPNRDIQEPEKDPKILAQADGKFADDFEDLNSV